MITEISINFDDRNLDKNEALNDILNFVNSIYDYFAEGLNIIYDNYFLRFCGKIDNNKFVVSFYTNSNDNLKIKNCLLRIVHLASSLKENSKGIMPPKITINLLEKAVNDKSIDGVIKLFYTICEANKLLKSVERYFSDTECGWDLGILSREEVDKLDRKSLKNYVKYLINVINNLVYIEIDSYEFKISYSDCFGPYLTIYVNDFNMFNRAVNILTNEIKNVVDNFYYAYGLLKGGKN